MLNLGLRPHVVCQVYMKLETKVVVQGVSSLIPDMKNTNFCVYYPISVKLTVKISECRKTEDYLVKILN